jgi:hypothetical protein
MENIDNKNFLIQEIIKAKEKYENRIKSYPIDIELYKVPNDLQNKRIAELQNILKSQWTNYVEVEDKIREYIQRTSNSKKQTIPQEVEAVTFTNGWYENHQKTHDKTPQSQFKQQLQSNKQSNKQSNLTPPRTPNSKKQIIPQPRQQKTNVSLPQPRPQDNVSPHEEEYSEYLAQLQSNKQSNLTPPRTPNSKKQIIPQPRQQKTNVSLPQDNVSLPQKTKVSSPQQPQLQNNEETYVSIGNGGSDGIGYMENGKRKYYSNQCILISIMDHLKLLGRLEPNCSIYKFRQTYGISDAQWFPYQDFQFGENAYQTRTLTRIMLEENLRLQFVLPKVDKNTETLLWTSNGMMKYPDYTKSLSRYPIIDVYILNIPGHYEVLINGFNENRYDLNQMHSSLKEKITRRSISDVRKLMDIQDKNTQRETEIKNNLTQLKRLKLLLGENKAILLLAQGNPNWTQEELDQMEQDNTLMEYHIKNNTPEKYYESNPYKNKYLKYKQKYLQLKNLLKKQKML